MRSGPNVRKRPKVNGYETVKSVPVLHDHQSESFAKSRAGS